MPEAEARALRHVLRKARKDEFWAGEWRAALDAAIRGEAAAPRILPQRSVRISVPRPEAVRPAELMVPLKLRAAYMDAFRRRPHPAVCAFLSLLSDVDGFLVRSSPLLDEIGLAEELLTNLAPNGWSLRAFVTLVYWLYLRMCFDIFSRFLEPLCVQHPSLLCSHDCLGWQRLFHVLV